MPTEPVLPQPQPPSQVSQQLLRWKRPLRPPPKPPNRPPLPQQPVLQEVVPQLLQLLWLNRPPPKPPKRPPQLWPQLLQVLQVLVEQVSQQLLRWNIPCHRLKKPPLLQQLSQPE
jgi:hypothetical protein